MRSVLHRLSLHVVTFDLGLMNLQWTKMRLAEVGEELPSADLPFVQEGPEGI